MALYSAYAWYRLADVFRTLELLTPYTAVGIFENA